MVICISVLLVIMVLLISMAREYNLGQSSRGVFVFVLAIISFCAVIALGMISAQGPKG